mgnify:CR=1 FL=1
MQAVSMCDVTVIGHPAPASPPTRAAWVDQLLRRAILTGELAPGEKLLGEKLAHDREFIDAVTELDDALLRLRFDAPEVGVIVIRTAGDRAQVLAHDAALAEVLVEAVRNGEDIGAEAVLERHARWRRFDTVTNALAFDAFVRIFSNDNPLLRVARTK